MRVFIAVDMPKEIENYLKKLQDEFRGLAKINFVNHFHATLKFLGEIEEEKVEEIKEMLRKIKFDSFELSLDKIGVFPDEKFVRVLWVGVKGNLNKLQMKIDESLLDLFSGDERFHSHVTLGRIKFLKKKEEFLNKLRLSIKPSNFKVDKFILYKSELRREGPKYTALEVYDLQ